MIVIIDYKAGNLTSVRLAFEHIGQDVIVTDKPEIIAKAEQITGKTVNYTTSPRRLGDPPVLLASKDKAERLFGWRLEYSDIETIIRTAWNWHSKHS